MMRTKQIDQKMIPLSNKTGWFQSRLFLLFLSVGILVSGLSVEKVFAQSAVITFASKSRPKVIQPDFRTTAKSYFSVIGEVKNPGCFEWTNESPTASEVISKAGGETASSQGTVRIVRRGRAGLRLMSSALTNYPLLAGDILIVEKRQEHQSRVISFDRNQSHASTSQPVQNQSNKQASICLLNLANYPAVIEVDLQDSTLGNILNKQLGLPEVKISDLRVISPRANRNQKALSAQTQIKPGSVIIFKSSMIEKVATKLPAPISSEQKKTVLTTPNAAPEPIPQAKNLTTQLSKPLKLNEAETLIPFGQTTDKVNPTPKPNNAPKDFPILAIPDLNLGSKNSEPKPLEKVELKPASTLKKQSAPNSIRLLPKPPEETEPKPGDLQASVKIQKFDRSLTPKKSEIKQEKIKVVQTALLESNDSKASPFPEYIENVKREALPPIEGEELTSAVPPPVGLDEVDLIAKEETSLSDLSLVGIISGVGILVAVISVLISALWNQLDEQSGPRELVAEQEELQQHREKVITAAKAEEKTLKSQNSTLQSLIDNNIPFVEEPVESPSKVEFFGNASKSRTYRVDPVHPRTSPKEADRKFAAEIPTPHYIKSKHLKKKGSTEAVGSVVQPPGEQPTQPQQLPEQEQIEDLENLANQNQTSERLDQGETNQNTQPPAGLIERALMAMKKEMENKKS